MDRLTDSFSKFASKDLIITKKINNVIYELMVKTRSNMVYTDDETTLTETLNEIFDLITSQQESYEDLKKAYDAIVEGADENFNSFKEIYDYININGDPESELIKLIKSKQTAEEGKGLSTNDFTDLLYKKLTNMYSKEELDLLIEEKLKDMATTSDIKEVNEKIEAVNKRVDDISTEIATKTNIIITDDASGLEVPDGDVWFNRITVSDEG